MADKATEKLKDPIRELSKSAGHANRGADPITKRDAQALWGYLVAQIGIK